MNEWVKERNVKLDYISFYSIGSLQARCMVNIIRGWRTIFHNIEFLIKWIIIMNNVELLRFHAIQYVYRFTFSYLLHWQCYYVKMYKNGEINCRHISSVGKFLGPKFRWIYNRSELFWPLKNNFLTTKKCKKNE